MRGQRSTATAAPSPHLHKVEALIVCLRLAIEQTQEQVQGTELCQLYEVCRMAEDELSEAYGKLEVVLRGIEA